MKKLISLILSICMVITGLPMVVYAASSTPEISLEEFSEQFSEMNEEYADEPVSNRIIVKSKRNINKFDSVDVVEGYNDLHIVQFDNSESAKQALEYYESNSYIEYAEEDMLISVTETENSLPSNYDNHLSWGSSTIGVDDYFDYLGDMSALPQIVVGIIDTGIDLDHEFLENRIIETNYNNSSSGKANSENDDNGHGTHVAGIVADNTTENVKIKSFKCMDSNGNGNILNVCLAVNAAVESNVNVINMSLGTRGTSTLLEDTINNAIDQGITVCVAAGNNGRLASNYTPANIESCITVGAINESDQKPLWSNYGDAVDIWAPGSDIYSSYNDGGYKNLSGTSMATPFVAAASALLISNNKNLEPNEVKDLIVDNSRPLEETFLDYELNALYIGVLNDFVNERTSRPVFSIDGGIYLEDITVEITCDDPNAEIYYSTNGKRASQDNGTLYTEPIIIDKVTTLNACAYADGKLKSLQTSTTYNIVTTDPDENFEINESGIITKYNGSNIYLSVPEKIKGITVTGIGDSVFRFKGMTIIVFPDSLTSIGDKAFWGTSALKAVYAKNIKYVGEFSFRDCRNLSEIDLTTMEYIGRNAFTYCESIDSFYSDKLNHLGRAAFSSSGIIYVDLPSTNVVEDYAFNSCLNLETVNLPIIETVGEATFYSDVSLKEINIPNVRSISGPRAFDSCFVLETLNLPNLEGEAPEETFQRCYNLRTLIIPHISAINEKALYGCYAVKTIFAPQLKTAKSLPTCNDVNIYLSDKCNELPITEYKYNIIAPSDSYAKQWANENKYTFIPSDSRDESIENPLNVSDLGRSICTYYSGLRFGFEWNEIPEIEELASNIEYGFVYSQKGVEDLSLDTVDGINVKTITAPNRIDHGDTTSFNLVISNIPKGYQDREITARAYVCIDGMYFYSNTLKGSFAEVSNLVLADDEIDINTKNAVKNLLEV